MKASQSPRIGNNADLSRELIHHATIINALTDGRLVGTNNAYTAAPTTGTHAVGDFVRNSAAASGGSVLYGWICTVGGTPGTWTACWFSTYPVFAYRAITALRTLDATDEIVDCDGTFAVTLPTAVGFSGQYTVKNSGAGVITVNTTASQTIDGNLTVGLNQYESITVRSTNTNWIII